MPHKFLCLAFAILLNCVQNSFQIEYLNGNLRVHKDNANVNLGSNFNFVCSLRMSGETLNSCNLETPSGDVWLIEGTAVTDTTTQQPVSGYTGSQSDPSLDCGITIAAVNSVDIGDWTCWLNRTGGATDLVKGVVNLRQGGFPPNLRLPSTTIPTRYDVDIVARLDPEFDINGGVTISVEELANNGLFTMHIAQTTVNEASFEIRDSANRPLTITEHIYDFERDFYKLAYVPSAQTPPFNLTVYGQFTGFITNAFYGLHYTVYRDRGSGETRYLALTELEPAGARRVFPCLDEPSLKAKFNFRIGHRSDFKALCNTELLASGAPVEGLDNFVYDEFVESVPMSTYLIAFAVGDIEHVQSAAKPPLFSNWARPDAIADQLAVLAKDVGPSQLDYFAKLFESPFPMAKMDQIAYTGSSGAMENYGLITYGEYVMLIDETQASAREKMLVVAVIGHELAHQWFGDLVTLSWWDYLWLNEGYAEYWEYHSEYAVAPYMAAWDRFMVDEIRNLMTYDDSSGSHPIMQEVVSPAQSDFGTITYSKGSTVNRMMEHMITLPAFVDGLKTYLKDLEYSNAVNEDLFSHLDDALETYGTIPSKYNISTLMNPWLNQKNYPLLTVRVDTILGQASLSQERFLIRPDVSGDSHNYQWYVPITYTKLDGTENFNNTHPITYLEPDSTIPDFNIGFGSEAVIFNLQQTGYYRVNYDQGNWDAIAQVLNSDHTRINPLNRAAIISDSYALAEAGIESFALTNQMTAYLTAETDYVPFTFACDIYFELENIVLPPPEAVILMSFLQQVYSSRYASLGIDANPSQTFVENMHHHDVIGMACGYDDPLCVSDALEVFHRYMNVSDPDDPAQNPVNSNARYAIYCAAIRNGGVSEYNFLQARLAKCYVTQEYWAIEDALSCRGTNKDELKFALKQTLKDANKTVRDLERLLKNPKSRSMARKFIRDNEMELAEKFGGKNLRFMMKRSM